jgi:hypothetical protein
MAGDEMMEERLRELLRDSSWSLPAWPNAEARVRRAARRQRIRTAMAGAAVAGIAAAVVATLTGFQAPGESPTVPAVALPAPGARGFPVSIYPPALRAHGGFSHCPDPDGLSPATGARARTVVATLDAVTRDDAASFTTDLRLTDRAYWQQADRGLLPRGGRVLYSAPLTSTGADARVAALSRAVRVSCGDRTARDTWLVITAAPGRPGGQSEYLLLDRRGHVLVWNAI